MPMLTFNAELEEPIKIELPRIYYFGYSLKSPDGEKIELRESEKGFLEADIERSGEYVLTYEKTTVMKVANIITIIAFLAIIITIIRKKYYVAGNKNIDNVNKN